MVLEYFDFTAVYFTGFNGLGKFQVNFDIFLAALESSLMERITYNSSPNFKKEFCVNLLDLLADDVYCDCSLVAEGKVVNAHRVVLSAASPYLKTIFNRNHGFNAQQFQSLIFESLKFADLQNLIYFVYKGLTKAKSRCIPTKWAISSRR